LGGFPVFFLIPSQGGVALSALYIGIDVSKDFFTAQAIDGKGNKCFYLELAMTADGFSQLLKAITSHCKDIARVTVAMESTGCYHINLFSFLTYKGIRCIIINPLLTANFARLSLRKTKTDKKDAFTIAQFLLVHKDSLLKTDLSPDMQDLKDLAREHESLTTLIAGMKNDIRRMLQITFPELETVCNIFSETILNLLRQFPSAHLIKIAKPNIIAKALLHEDKRKKTSVSAEDIMKAAKGSVASHGAAKEIILPEKISTLQHLVEKKNRIKKALVDACENMMIEDIEIITSIGGISNITASRLLAEIGDYRAFSTYKHLIAFAGLDPSVHQSGKFEGVSRISKRGNRHLRYIIYLMTTCVVRGNNIFRSYYQKRRSEGQPFKKAIIATAHKLVRVIFAMLSNRTTYKSKEVNAQ
jgi:transposase